MRAVVMAGGLGTRIREIALDVPKPLVEVGGRAVLERTLGCLAEQGFCDVMLTVSHMADVVEERIGDGSSFGVHVSYFREEEPLGTAGALLLMRDWLGEEFLVLNADSVFDVDLMRLVAFHREMGGLATILTHPNDHPWDSGLIVAGSDHAVTAWLAREDVRPRWYKNRVNAGIHVLSLGALDVCRVVPGGRADLDRDVLRPLCARRELFCYDSPEYVKDMGTPERFWEVSRDLESGLVSAKSLRRPQRAVFLDRDGTLNRYVGFLRDACELELLPGVAEAIQRIHSAGYLAVLVTNQPVLARGEVTTEGLQAIHAKLETLLAEDGAYLDATYVCPHHPDKGFTGEVTELKVECGCRKPRPGMLLKAMRDLNIDLSASWMVGDGWRDVEAGRAAGCRTALVGEDDLGQDVTVGSLLEFAELLHGAAVQL